MPFSIPPRMIAGTALAVLATSMLVPPEAFAQTGQTQTRSQMSASDITIRETRTGRTRNLVILHKGSRIGTLSAPAETQAHYCCTSLPPECTAVPLGGPTGHCDIVISCNPHMPGCHAQ